LNSDELFKSDVKNFDGQNIEKFVSDTYENSISHLQNRGEIADSLDELRNYFKRKNTELENGLKQCLNIVSLVHNLKSHIILIYFLTDD
jgi:hypothetical protein